MVVYPPQGVRYCSPDCPLFRCARKALKKVGRKYVCTLTGDECVPKNCNFASCAINKLLPGGICGKEIRRRTRPIRLEEESPSPTSFRGKVRGIRDELL